MAGRIVFSINLRWRGPIPSDGQDRSDGRDRVGHRSDPCGTAVPERLGFNMESYSLAKKPAFFPSVSAELFFEAEANSAGVNALFDTELDAELDAILNATEDTTV